jgi:hypothetical protein
MKTIERRLERLEAIHGGPLPSFPELTGLAESKAEIAIEGWLTSVKNRPFGESPQELFERIIAELSPNEIINLAKYFQTKFVG